jgi:lipopolysaccharide export system protein LptC
MALAPDDTMGGDAPRRARTFAAARNHTRFVRLLKFAIPVGSALTIGTLVAWSVFNPLGRLIPGLTIGPVTVSGSKIAMEAPRLTGFRKDNRAYEVTAVAAYQDIRKPNVIELKDMKAKLVLDDNGGTAHLVSSSGIFDTGKEHLDLNRDIKVWTNKGEVVDLKSASFDFKTGNGSSREAVRITTPTMTVDAQSLDLSENGQKITFTGGVRTVLKGGGETLETKNDKSGAAPARVNHAEAGGGR